MRICWRQRPCEKKLRKVMKIKVKKGNYYLKSSSNAHTIKAWVTYCLNNIKLFYKHLLFSRKGLKDEAGGSYFDIALAFIVFR